MASEAEDRIHEILEEWLERRRKGEAPEAEEVLRAHPELAEELSERLESLQVLDEFLDAGAPSTRTLDEIPRFKARRNLESRRASMDTVYELDPAAIRALEQAIAEGLLRNRKAADALAAVSETPFATRRTARRTRATCSAACAEVRSMRDALATMHVTLTACRDRLSGSQKAHAVADPDATGADAATTWTDMAFGNPSEHVVDVSLHRGEDLSDSLTGFIDRITEILAERPTDQGARRLISTAKNLAGNVLVASEWWEKGARELLQVLSDAVPDDGPTKEFPDAVSATGLSGTAGRDERSTGSLEGLEHGALHSFADWPGEDVPHAAAGVYTVWSGEDLVYVGRSERGQSTEDTGEAGKTRGLFARLGRHATGRRSSDPLHVQVCDRLVLPTLDAMTIHDIGEGRASLDDLVRLYIHQHLGYRFVVVEDGQEAKAIEAHVKRGALAAGKPLLNPDG